MAEKSQKSELDYILVVDLSSDLLATIKNNW